MEEIFHSHGHAEAGNSFSDMKEGVSSEVKLETERPHYNVLMRSR